MGEARPFAAIANGIDGFDRSAAALIHDDAIAAKLNAEFFPDGRYRANFLCNLGVGDPARLYPRGPRLSFEDACEIA